MRGDKSTRAQLEQKFLDGGGTRPRNELLLLCAFCQNPTIDKPPKNNGVIDINKERLDQHATLTKQWNVYKDGKGPCPTTLTGRAYLHAHPIPAIEALLLHVNQHLPHQGESTDFPLMCA